MFINHCSAVGNAGGLIGLLIREASLSKIIKVDLKSDLFTYVVDVAKRSRPA